MLKERVNDLERLGWKNSHTYTQLSVD
jgi:hypothetical protein